MSTTLTDDVVPLSGAEGEGAPIDDGVRRYRGGWRIVARKEFADHVHSARFVILIILLALAGLASVHSASGPIRDAADTASSTPSIFLYLFTLSPDRVPSFYEFIGIPRAAARAFGFDRSTANGRSARCGSSRNRSRDEIISSKFVAGIGARAGLVASSRWSAGTAHCGSGGSDVVRRDPFDRLRRGGGRVHLAAGWHCRSCCRSRAGGRRRRRSCARGVWC
jgi:hypothetical protein